MAWRLEKIETVKNQFAGIPYTSDLQLPFMLDTGNSQFPSPPDPNTGLFRQLMCCNFLVSRAPADYLIHWWPCVPLPPPWVRSPSPPPGLQVQCRSSCHRLSSILNMYILITEYNNVSAIKCVSPVFQMPEKLWIAGVQIDSSQIEAWGTHETEELLWEK